AVLLISVLLSGTAALASETDDYIPEVTDRVARISFVTGDVQIRRADSPDWEVAVLNLPIVEGDEIATDGNGRLEIQFNSYMHLRVAENSQIKFVGLQDGGIALSVPLGTVVLRAAEFDASRSFFEIDAPKTTIAIRKSGTYRIEAGVPDSLEVIVSATDGGEARVYSADAGLTVKNGRRAKIFIGGSQSGEWETAEAERFKDEFDNWSLDRDAAIAQRLKDAYYDRYYDRDMYGAEDLNGYGDWIHTKKYGDVWRPYSSSISQYSNWSPYRYGHWRWVPPYGWTWINDEPWGWATYHHGRWVWDSGSWYWTPYGYYRDTRSWWHPALVVLRTIGGNVCWYPLPYNYGYYDYNSYYYSHHRRRHHGDDDWGNNHGGWNPNSTAGLPGPAPGTPPVVTPIRNGRDKVNAPPLENVPPIGVVTVAASEFGRGKGHFTTPPLAVAKSVLSIIPDAGQSPPILPTYSDLNGKVSQEIRVFRPPMVRTRADVQTGATVRKTEAPLDQELQKSRIFGGRPPLQINTSQGEIRTVNTTDVPRKTGAIERPVIKQEDPDETPVRRAPTRRQETPVNSPPTTKQRDETENEPVRVPRADPPSRREEPRNEPIRTPRYDPPTRNDPPPVRDSPPPRNYPPPTKSEPAPKSDPPPTKSEPSKPDGPVDRKKDGR
ncbi:MAG: DUF6600 domain-containing protein, partial [Acidobacteriota bacterium]